MIDREEIDVAGMIRKWSIDLGVPKLQHLRVIDGVVFGSCNGRCQAYVHVGIIFPSKLSALSVMATVTSFPFLISVFDVHLVRQWRGCSAS
jgi:hypothetical protein